MCMIGMFGAACVLGLAATGSAIGIGIAGQAAVGAWKRCYVNNKPAPATLIAFAGAPLTQTIYGFLLMRIMVNSQKDGMFLLALGLFSGLAMAASAVFQGKAGAAGSDALGETGKGFVQYLTVVGLAESVALFATVLSILMLL